MLKMANKALFIIIIIIIIMFYYCYYGKVAFMNNKTNKFGGKVFKVNIM